MGSRSKLKQLGTCRSPDEDDFMEHKGVGKQGEEEKIKGADKQGEAGFHLCSRNEEGSDTGSIMPKCLGLIWV